MTLSQFNKELVVGIRLSSFDPFAMKVDPKRARFLADNSGEIHLR